MKEKLLGAAAGLLIAVGAWAAPALAGGVLTQVCDGWGACASDYSSWQGVQVSDVDCDGQGVYSEYARDTGSSQVLNNYTGCNTTQQSGTSTNLINHFNACVNVPWPYPDHCSSTVYR